MRIGWVAIAAALTMTTAQAAEPSGSQLFMNHCAACHGEAGEGDGPVASVMAINVPNLRSLTMRSGGEFPTDAVTAYIDGRDVEAAHGSRAMPIWGDAFQSDDDESSEQLVRKRIAALVGFIASLQYR